MEEEIGQKKGKLEWFLYMIFFPLLFTVILSAVLLQFLGYNVTGQLLTWGNSVPYVEKVIPGSNPKSQEADGANPVAELEEEYKKRIEELTQQLVQEQDKIAQLEAKMKEKDAEILTLNQESEQLRKQNEAAKKEQDNKKEVAAVYTSMSPSKAAPIMEAMPLDQAVKILRVLNKDERGAILAKLDPAKAATMTSELLKGE